MVAATGIGSGLDIEGIVTALVAAEREPVQERLLTREATLTSELSGFGTLQSALGGLQASLSSLSSFSTFTQRSVSSSNEAVFSASSGSGAVNGNYSIEVNQLAGAQSLASTTFSSASDVIGEGELTFRFGTTDYTEGDPDSYDGFTLNADRDTATLTIDAGNNTVQGLRDAINAADFGVTAAIVNDGSGVRLLLSSDQTGADNSIEITVDDIDGDDNDNNGLSRLAFNEAAASANGGVAPLTQTVAGQDASFRINGLLLSSDSNTVEEAIDGITLTLNGVTEGAPETLTVADNSTEVRSAIESFVATFNTFISTANNLTSYDPETGNAGSLQGDATARSVISQVRNGVTGAARGYAGPFTTIAEIGITTTADGTLEIDDARLSAALSDNFNSVAGIFAGGGVSSDTSLSLVNTSTATAVGSYAVDITVEGVTAGAVTGNDITPITNAKLRIDGGNETLGLNIDGIERTFTLTRGTYSSPTEIAGVIETDINDEFAGDGVSVSVIYNGTGYEITSNSLGSGSRVEITAIDNRTTNELGFAIGQGSTGADAITSATIGGQPATIEGTLLTGAVGTDVEGLQVRIGSLVSGTAGTITVSEGVISPLDNLLGGLLGGNGTLDARAEGLQSSIDRIDDDRETLDRRLEALEARYRQQFNALDILLANLQSTGNFIQQQLDNIPLPGSNNN